MIADETVDGARTPGRKELLGTRLGRARSKLRKRIAAISRDLDEMARAQKLAEWAGLVVHEAARLPRGARSLRGTDWVSGEAFEIPLDPAKTAKEQIDAIFHRARRMRRGESIAKARKADAEKALDAVEAIAAHLPFADDEALDAMQARLDAILPREIRRAAAPKEERERALAHRTFEAQSGRILVGRGAAHNDALTFRVAKPHHLWMHARGVAGAHVIVPLPRDRSCPPDLLIDAAHLAAHFSDARGEAVVEIAHAPRKWVRKPRGAPPGLVVVDREKVLVLRVEPDRLARLLAREI